MNEKIVDNMVPKLGDQIKDEVIDHGTTSSPVSIPRHNADVKTPAPAVRTDHASQVHTESTGKVESTPSKDHKRNFPEVISDCKLPPPHCEATTQEESSDAKLTALPAPSHEGDLVDRPNEKRRRAFAAKRERFKSKRSISAFYERVLASIRDAEEANEQEYIGRIPPINNNPTTAQQTELHLFAHALEFLHELDHED